MKKIFISVFFIIMQLNSSYALNEQDIVESEYPLPDITGSEQSQNNEIPAVSEEKNEYMTPYTIPVNHYKSQEYKNNNHSNTCIVPVNTKFPAILVTPISSETAKLGDNITFYLPSDFYYKGKLIAGSGSMLYGTVILVKRAGVPNKNAKLQVRFSNIKTPSGQMIPVSACIETNDGTGILQAGNTDVEGLEMITSLLEKGENIEIPKNAQMNIVLDQPVTVTSNTPY